MRSVLVVLHRGFGLFIAVFLFISGLTGAIISWDHELDEWLNPQLFVARSAFRSSTAPVQSPLALAQQLETRQPELLVTFLPLNIESGHTLTMSVTGHNQPTTGKAAVLDYNQLALDPVTAEIQGKRLWGALSLTRENLLPFLYKLHYSMHLPDGWGMELGVLLMGIVGIVWALDCMIALWISFPALSVWRKSFTFRWRQGGYKFHFDLHRSGGVWIWGVLLIVAVTSVSMNLGTQVMRPLVSRFSTLTPTPFETRTPVAMDQTIPPTIPRETVLHLARKEAQQRGWAQPAGAIFYAPQHGLYGVGFFSPGNGHGDGGLGNPWLYFDGGTGTFLGAQVPGQGSAGDLFMQAQFPLHSGRILGLPGRILMSLIGLAVALLSATGVLIWIRKRQARQRYHTRSATMGLPEINQPMLAIKRHSRHPLLDTQK